MSETFCRVKCAPVPLRPETTCNAVVGKCKLPEMAHKLGTYEVKNWNTSGRVLSIPGVRESGRDWSGVGGGGFPIRTR
jgi:hypothetical protein